MELSVGIIFWNETSGGNKQDECECAPCIKNNNLKVEKFHTASRFATIIVGVGIRRYRVSHL